MVEDASNALASTECKSVVSPCITNPPFMGIKWNIINLCKLGDFHYGEN